MSDNAPTPTADQIAAFQRLDKILGNADQPFGDENWALVRKCFPDTLTNPQPALPTEPGAFLDRYNHAVQLDEEGRWWYGAENYDPSGAGPFTRLVPERPQVTREQIADHLAACSELPRLSNMDMADSLLDLVYGTPA